MTQQMPQKIVAEDTKLEFFKNTRDVWDAMYRDCSRAEKSIEFEQYILRDDGAGHRFLELFTEKARQGVAVRLLLDRIGSRKLCGSPFVAEIRKSGGEVYFYNSIGWRHLLSPSAWFPRNHTKTMLIDSRIVYIGSACLAEHMRNWRDTQVRFTGRLAQDVMHDFARMWCRPPKCKPPHVHTRRSFGEMRRRLFRYVVTRPLLTDNPIYTEILEQIYKAQHSVRLVTPYFMPPWRLRQALRDAVKRGVDVTLMMGEKTDTPLADRVSQSYFSHFMRDGIRILLYGKTVLHSKYVIVDDNWATLGSTNIDYLSLLRNREANIIIRDPQTIAALSRLFAEDRRECTEIGNDYWRGRPLGFRIGGYLGRTVRHIL